MTNRLSIHDALISVEEPAKIVGALSVLAGLVVGFRKGAEKFWRWFVPKFERYQRICLLEDGFRSQFGEAPALALRRTLEEMHRGVAFNGIKGTVMASQLSFGFYICRADTGENIFANPVFAEMWGLEAKEMAGVGWVQCLHDDDKQRALMEWQFSVKYGLPYHCTYKVTNARTKKLFLIETRATITDYIGETKVYAGWVKMLKELPQ